MYTYIQFEFAVVILNVVYSYRRSDFGATLHQSEYIRFAESEKL